MKYIIHEMCLKISFLSGRLHALLANEAWVIGM